MSQPTKLGGFSTKPFDPAGLARRHGALIIVLASMLALLLGAASQFLRSSYYEASGMLEVARVLPPVASDNERASIQNFFQDYVRTQVETLRSPPFIQTVLEQFPEETRLVLAPEGVPLPTVAQVLARQLEVYHLGATHLIVIKLKDKHPEGLAPLINGIMRHYIQRERDTALEQNLIRADLLSGRRQALAEEAASIEATLQELAVITGTSTFHEEYNKANMGLEEMEKAYAEAMATRARLEHQYAETIVQTRKLQTLPVQSLADEMVAQDESLWSISYWTYKELQGLRASIDGATSKNPDRRYIEERMAAMQDYEKDLTKSVASRALRIVEDKRDYKLESDRIQAQHAYQAANQTEYELKARLETKQQHAAVMSQRLLQGDALTSRLKFLRDEIQKYESRVTEVELESKNPSRASIQSFALPPLGPAGNNAKKLLIMSVGMSFLVVFGVFVVAEFLDERIRSPKDLQNAVGGPVAWPISQAPNEIEFARLSLADPGGQAAKALRSLAFRVREEHEASGAKIFLVTGTQHGVGVTGVVSNVAHFLSNFFPSILVVDAAGGGLWRIFGPENFKNGCDAPTCLLDLTEDTIGLGKLAVDPARGCHVAILDRQEWSRRPGHTLPQALATCRNRYDCILIDAPPLVTSDLTELLAMHADACLLLAGGDLSLYSHTRFSMELLDRLNIPAVAPVLNWGPHRRRTLLDRAILALPFARRLVGSLQRIQSPPPTPKEMG